MARGRFISFEGVEGSGKTTQVELLAARLRDAGYPVMVTREPGGTAVGERLRAILLDPSHKPTAISELLILEAARAQLVAEAIGPALQAGTTVLCDRFADSSLAYQGGGRGLDWQAVRDLNSLACQGVTPDRTLVFELPISTALARARGRASTTAANCRFEDEELAFHERVAAAYRELARIEPERVRVVDASGTPAAVFERVWLALAGILP